MVGKQEHKTNKLNRLETQLETIEPIRIIKQSKTTDLNQEHMNNTYLEIDMEWKWNWKMMDRKNLCG